MRKIRIVAATIALMVPAGATVLMPTTANASVVPTYAGIASYGGVSAQGGCNVDRFYQNFGMIGTLPGGSLPVGLGYLSVCVPISGASGPITSPGSRPILSGTLFTPSNIMESIHGGVLSVQYPCSGGSVSEGDVITPSPLPQLLLTAAFSVTTTCTVNGSDLAVSITALEVPAPAGGVYTIS